MEATSFARPNLPGRRFPTKPPCPRRFVPMKKVVITSATRDTNGRDYSGRLVDEDMIVLRLRIRETKILETSYEPPSNWMEWEKQYYIAHDYDKDVCEAMVLSLVVCWGYLVASICRPPPEFFRFTIIVTAFGNTGNLPLAIVGSVCHSTDNPFGPDCHRTGVAYVSFAQWVAVLLVYTLVYHMMEPPLEYYEVVEEGIEIEEQLPANDISRPLLVEAEWPGMEDKETEHCKTPFIARVFTSVSSLSQTSIPDPDALEQGGPRSPKSIRCLAEPRMVRKIRIVAEQTPIRHILQPPTIATLLAFFVGMFPPIKNIVYGDDAPLSFITDSLDIMAGAMVPSVMLILGGMIAEGPNESKLGIRTTVGIIIARLLVLPLVGIGIVCLADRMNLLIPGDQMYRKRSFGTPLLAACVCCVLSFNVYHYLLQTAAFLCLRDQADCYCMKMLISCMCFQAR
ncbi:hypothetical protein F0562_004182 [Nyssa sinensis]|uniref:Auxin efflux carrier component n=1 Tax=Nyssa sinensis TaxID=561372 RepID=A0A5J5BX68_9ASTE|nr:hypothetical protein F0562_004182 [Nyssa sinensis]